ncbi:hypothetical protein RJ641_030715 [Dillenia turbinata]|uniref:EF-hand domain-containing protein n=1 Tax=Dillenia turbinata TaxID=194707 RepID=A0AAN8VWT6_9MAGN
MTVRYGDKAFKTVGERLFVAIWLLLLSTLAVGRAFLYPAEARVDKRHRRIANWVKSEYVVFKLKEMGKDWKKDIIQICNHFNKLDPASSGKITLPNLLQLLQQPPRP